MSSTAEHTLPNGGLKETPQGATPDDEERSVVRLSVNLAPTVAAALKTTARRKGLSITEAIRHAVTIWKLVTDEQEKGNRVMIVSGEGDRAQFREVVMI